MTRAEAAALTAVLTDLREVATTLARLHEALGITLAAGASVMRRAEAMLAAAEIDG